MATANEARKSDDSFREAMKAIVVSVLSNKLGETQKWQQHLLLTVPKDLLEKRVLEFFK